MIPYFIALLLLGIPIGWAEWTIARYGGVAGFTRALVSWGGWRWVPVPLPRAGVLIPLVVCMYYVLIESWCLRYFLGYAFGTLDLGADPAGYAEALRVFATIAGADADGLMRDGSPDTSLYFLIGTLSINFFLIYRGIAQGIEKFCGWRCPLWRFALWAC